MVLASAPPPSPAPRGLDAPPPAGLPGPVLVLATSGPAAEVGLALPGAGALLRSPLGDGAARGRGLLPAVSALLARAGLAPRDLAALAVDVGPGSFTGVRVGGTAAKSLALALGCPVVAVDSLTALARSAPPQRAVLAVRDAGRGTLYAGAFEARAQGGAPCGPPERLPGAALHERHPDAVLVGEDAVRLAALHRLPHPAVPGAADAARVLAVAAERLHAGATTPPDSLVPLYLQASAPERLAAGEAPPAAGRPGAA